MAIKHFFLLIGIIFLVAGCTIPIKDDTFKQSAIGDNVTQSQNDPDPWLLRDIAYGVLGTIIALVYIYEKVKHHREKKNGGMGGIRSTTLCTNISPNVDCTKKPH